MDFAHSIRSDLVPSFTAAQIQYELVSLCERGQIALLKHNRKRIAMVLPIAVYDELEILIEILQKTKELRDIIRAFESRKTITITSKEFDAILRKGGVFIERLREEWLLKQKELVESSLSLPQLPLKKD